MTAVEEKLRMTVAFCLLLTGCWGNSSVDNDGVCQPKKIHHNTPLICGNYDSVDVSLGVVRNGVGSMSTHDMTLVIPDGETKRKLEQAIAAGKLVNLHYNERRFSWCQELAVVTAVDILETTSEVTEDAEQKKRDIQKQIDALQKKLEGGAK